MISDVNSESEALVDGFALSLCSEDKAPRTVETSTESVGQFADYRVQPLLRLRQSFKWLVAEEEMRCSACSSAPGFAAAYPMPPSIGYTALRLSSCVMGAAPLGFSR